MSTRVYCFLHNPSWIIEGNLNTCSIYEQLIKNIDKFFNLQLKYNYSYNSSSSNMKINQLPCIYYEGNRKKREEIYSFFQSTLIYDRFPLYPEEGNNKNNLILSEIEILKNILLFDFQEIIDYINYNKKQNTLGNIIRFLYQPVKKLNSITIDRDIIKYIETKYHISNKKDAIEYIKMINEKINWYLGYIIDKDFINNMNIFLILIYACYKTQGQFFTERKMIKYKLNQYDNIKKFINKIDYAVLNNNLYIKAIFQPEKYFNDNKINLSEEAQKEKSDEGTWRSKKYLLQAIAYGTIFTFLYYVKKKL